MKSIFKGIFLFWIFSSLNPTYAMPSMVNYIPNCDTVAYQNFFLTTGILKYSYSGPLKDAHVATDNSTWYGLQLGLKKAEIGVDYLSNKAFVDERSALYPGPVCYNFKYRLLTEGKDPISLAIGSYNLGAPKLNDLPFDCYYPSPYIVGTKTIRSVRFHLGYQTALVGYKNVDYDKKKNDGVIAGFDTVILKSKNHALTLLAEYLSGPMSSINVGLQQSISARWSWSFCSFHPLTQHLEPVQGSPVEFPRQYYFGVGYQFPCGFQF
ncbi:MAG: hypothetical protein HQM08_24605 [Candidatus Riflebacteria bacterium]|nr:hypothetical protein [Candidatus Riflebacteria bacterium]